MKKTMIVVVALAMGVIGLAGAASAKPALKDVAAIREGIIATGMAYEVGQKCDTISARFFRGVSYLNSLKGHAKGLGYTNDEIDAYVDDGAEKNRLEGIARARLADMGAVVGDEASYCAVGRAEIAKDSVMGQLLR